MKVAVEGGVTNEMPVPYEWRSKLRNTRHDRPCPHYHTFLLSLFQVKVCPLPLDMNGTPGRPRRRK